MSRAADSMMVDIPAGNFIRGSTPEERSAAYDDFRRTSGRDSARDNNWFEKEHDRASIYVDAYRLDFTPVTVTAYGEFILDTDRLAPTIDEATWTKQGFVQKWPDEVSRFAWVEGNAPVGRADHPVVLVTWDDAVAYCKWRGDVIGEPRRLPTSTEFEKASRGRQASTYPWGPNFDPAKLNSAVTGPRDTISVGSFPAGASSYGVLGLAGNVFQWTSTKWPHRNAAMTVKGSAWDDHGGLGRGAAQHGRRSWVKHVIVGFRCAAGK